MKKTFRSLTGILCAALLVTATEVSTVKASEDNAKRVLPSGMTVEGFQRELEEKANELGGGEPEFASAAVGVFQNGEILYTGYFGKTDMENSVPAGENSVYEWGSISKTLIWVCAMQLWEQGKLDLERDVREYLPQGFFQNLSYDEPITMLNLMNHNAGWQETTRPIWKTDENAILSLEEELRAIEPAQIHRPGEVTAYSNYGAAVAGYVIERVAGQDYCEYVHEHIFEPLGMERTALNPAHSDNAWVYDRRKKTQSYQFKLGSCFKLGNCLNYVPAYPAGAATGTLTDLMIYAQALVNEDAPLFQDPETQEYLFAGTEFYGDSDIPTCAHGFWCEEFAVRAYGHSGATTAGQANMIIDPDSKTGLVVMINEPDGNWYLSCTPTLVFGMLSPDKYVSGTVEKAGLHGYYLPARSTYRGMLKFVPYLLAVPAKNIGDVDDIGRGVYRIRNGGSAVLLGAKAGPDGSTALQQSSEVLLHDGLYLVKLGLLTVYVLLAVAATYSLRIRRKLKKHGKWKAFRGSAVMMSGQAARLVSVLALLGTFVVHASYRGGIPYGAGALIGVLQMICMATCCVAAAVAVAALIKEKAHACRYVASVMGNVVTITAIVYFEMYRFWQV